MIANQILMKTMGDRFCKQKEKAFQINGEARRGILKELEPKHDDIRKTKRNRRQTECNVIRSKTGCGICGSENVADQGVKYCEICGEEADYLIHSGFWLRNEMAVDCDCHVEYKTAKGKIQYYRKLSWMEVGKCMDCGAVRSNFCPNCKFRRCWKSSKGQLYCQRCGFRRQERGF